MSSAVGSQFKKCGEPLVELDLASGSLILRWVIYLHANF